MTKELEDLAKIKIWREPDEERMKRPLINKVSHLLFGVVIPLLAIVVFKIPMFVSFVISIACAILWELGYWFVYKTIKFRKVKYLLNLSQDLGYGNNEIKWNGIVYSVGVSTYAFVHSCVKEIKLAKPSVMDLVPWAFGTIAFIMAYYSIV